MLTFVLWHKHKRERAAAVDIVIKEVASWPGVTAAPHPFDAVEFQLAGVELARLHRDGWLEVPFVRRIRDALVEDGAAWIHPWVPKSGWTSFQVDDDASAVHAVFLLKLACLYRAVANPRLGVPRAWIEDALNDLDLGGPISEVFDDLTAPAEA